MKYSRNVKFALILFLCFAVLHAEALIPDGNNAPLVFIHGIWGGYRAWRPMIRKISPSGNMELGFINPQVITMNPTGPDASDQIWNVTYYTPNAIAEFMFGNLTEYAQRLGRAIELIKNRTHSGKVNIIAFSMGGLVARRYMTLSQANWDSVHKILTVGTPNEGVFVLAPIVGQLIDMHEWSPFMDNLRRDWDRYTSEDTYKKWGVLAGVDTASPGFMDWHPTNTDSGGLGYTTIGSAIPYGEWQQAISRNIEHAVYDTQHFGFRMAVISTHLDLRQNPSVLKGIDWVIKD